MALPSDFRPGGLRANDILGVVGRWNHSGSLSEYSTREAEEPHSAMVVWSSIEATCPMCRHRLRVREVGAGFALGQDTDLLIRMEGKHVIQAEIHSCRNCRFSGPAADYTDRTYSSAAIQRYFRDVVGQLTDEPANVDRNWNPEITRTPLPHIQHYWSALAGTALGIPSADTGRRYLRAYWSLRLSPSRELPETELKPLRKRFLQASIAHLRHSLRREPNRVVVYLVGELCRRNRNFGLAAQYFDRFLTREDGPAYIQQAARKLRASIDQHDSSERSMEELLYGQGQDSGKRDRRPE
jgi:hypothetical protein